MGSPKSWRKGGLGNRVSRLAWEELWLPVAPLVAIWWGRLEFRRCTPEREEEGAGEGMGCAPGKKSAPAKPHLEPSSP